MSSVRVSYTWCDGSTMAAQVWAEDGYYPEAIAVARVTAVTAFIEAINELDDAEPLDLATELATLEDEDE